MRKYSVTNPNPNADLASFAIAIMAAGKGTRLKSKRPKVLHEIGGQPLLLHVIAAARALVPAERIFCITGHEAAKVESAVAPTGVAFIHQPEQRGTGHALQMVKSFFAQPDAPATSEHLLVLSGDAPLIRPETLRTLATAHLQHDAAMTILTAVPPDPTGYGRVVRLSPGSPDVAAIVEQKSLTPQQLNTPEINSGIYCFETAKLFAELGHLNPANPHAEFYLTDIAALLVARQQKVIAVQAPDADEVLGANTIAEMMHLDAAMRLSTARRLMAQGVTIFRPETSVIDSQVEVAPDTVLEPFVQLLGPTRIGPDCLIRSFSVIQSSTLGESVTVRNGCILDHALVGDGAILGPYAHLRPDSNIGPEAHIGNFVETKKVTIGKGSKANHLTYLGDAIIGENTNIGAGTITCNYDGEKKHLTLIGDNAFIGSDSTLIAPIAIGDGAYVAAASCITDPVPADSLAFGRARQVTKQGWAAKRRADKPVTPPATP